MCDVIVIIMVMVQWGRTVLHLAVSSADYNYCIELINRGADIRIRDRSDRTCLEVAAENDQFGLLSQVFCGIRAVDQCAFLSCLGAYGPDMLMYMQGLSVAFHERLASQDNAQYRDLMNRLPVVIDQAKAYVTSIPLCDYGLQDLVKILNFKSSECYKSNQTLNDMTDKLVLMIPVIIDVDILNTMEHTVISLNKTILELSTVIDASETYLLTLCNLSTQDIDKLNKIVTFPKFDKSKFQITIDSTCNEMMLMDVHVHVISTIKVCRDE